MKTGPFLAAIVILASLLAGYRHGDRELCVSRAITEHLLTAELRVDLLGNVSVLRLDNEDSYQGPLSEDNSL